MTVLINLTKMSHRSYSLISHVVPYNNYKSKNEINPKTKIIDSKYTVHTVLLKRKPFKYNKNNKLVWQYPAISEMKQYFFQYFL